VLTVVQMLRKQGVVGKFVEFFGAGLDNLSVADKATIANMAPEYGATCGFFPVDKEAIDYLKTTGRASERVALVTKYAKAQGLFRDSKSTDPVFTETLTLDLGSVVPSLAGPKRPEGRVALLRWPEGGVSPPRWQANTEGDGRQALSRRGPQLRPRAWRRVIAAITSCTNTSNPSVLLGAGFWRETPRQGALTAKPWVKTSLAPGSQVVAEYSPTQLAAVARQGRLQSGRFAANLHRQFGSAAGRDFQGDHDNGIIGAAVLSGNRNFEGRVSPDVQANYLASPPLVVPTRWPATSISIWPRSRSQRKDGKPVYLKDIWRPRRRSHAFTKKYVTAKYSRRNMPTVQGRRQLAQRSRP